MGTQPTPAPGPGEGGTSIDPTNMVGGFNLRILNSLSQSIACGSNKIGLSIGITAATWGNAEVTLQVSLDGDGSNWYDTSSVLNASNTALLNLDIHGVGWVRAKVTTGDEDATGNADIFYAFVVDETRSGVTK